MAKKQDPKSAALKVVKQFLELSFDKNDVEGARALISKASREGSQFQPSDMKGGKYTIGEATVEGEGDAAKVIVATTITPPPEVGQPAMTVPLTLIQEEGQWGSDLVETMNRLFGGSMEAMVDELGNAMGKAMEGLGNAIGEAMEKLSPASRATEPKLPAEEIERFEKSIAGDIELIRRDTDADITFDIDYTGFLQHPDDQTNRLALQRLGDMWRPFEYMIRQSHAKFPLPNRLAVVRIEPAPPLGRILFAESGRAGKLVYRCDPLADDGYYDVSAMERILPGVLAGMPEYMDPRNPPRKGPVAWLEDDGATLEEKYRVQLLPEETRRLSELVGQDVEINIPFYDIGSDADRARAFMLWGASRVVGAAALLVADESTRDNFRGTLREVVFTRVDPGLQSVECSGPSLRIYLCPDAGEQNCFYECQIADAIAKGLMLRERPVINDLRRNADEWESRLLDTYGRPIIFQIDFPGFCSHAEPARNLFALQLLREHGIDHVYYAVNGLTENNPNFKQQFAARVEALRLVHVPSPGEKTVRAEDGAIVVGMYLHEGYNGYFTIKDLEKKLPAVVAAMPDANFNSAADETAALETLEQLARDDEDDDEQDQDADDDVFHANAQGDQPNAEFLQMREHIQQTLPIYAQQMLQIVGKAIAVEMDWDTLATTDDIGNLLNAGLTPVIGGVMIATSNDPALKATLTARIKRILLRNTTDATEQGFTIDADKLVYTIILAPGMPPMDPQLAATLIKNALSAPAPRRAAPKKPAPKPQTARHAPKKPIAEKKPPAKKTPPAKKPSAKKPPAKKAPSKKPAAKKKPAKPAKRKGR